MDLPTLAQSMFLAQFAPLGLTDCNSNTDHGLRFKPGTSQDNVNTIMAAAAAYDWSGASIKLPDVTGFITAVNADPLSTANDGALIFQMSGLLAIFEADMQAQSIPDLQGHWQNAILLYGPNGSQGTWLTSAVQTMLLGYASQFAIPLQ